MITLIALYSILSHSYAQSLQRFCFSSNMKRKMAKSEFLKFKLKKEEFLEVDSKCFDLLLGSEKRISFWNSFLDKRHGGVNKTFSEFKFKECNIKTTKVAYDHSANQQTRLGKSSKFNKERVKESKKKEGFIKVTSGKKAGITFDNETLKFKCTYKNDNLYEIEFFQKIEEVKNLFYTINGQEFWKQVKNESESLQTTVTLKKGEKIEVGGISKHKSNNRKKMGIPSGINFNKEDGNLTYKVYLTIQ